MLQAQPDDPERYRSQMSTIFDALHEATRRCGGTVASPAGWPLRWDVRPSQAEQFNALLCSAGWRPQPCGTTTRVGHDGFHDHSDLVFQAYTLDPYIELRLGTH
jgi:hypothetical protein